MYIFSFNINQQDNNNVRVLTEFPTLLTNESLSLIIEEIRSIIKYNFENLSIANSIPIIDFRLGVSAVYIKDDFITTHSFSLNFENIRESIDLIKS